MSRHRGLKHDIQGYDDEDEHMAASRESVMEVDEVPPFEMLPLNCNCDPRIQFFQIRSIARFSSGACRMRI
jgi:hypothetical protein